MKDSKLDKVLEGFKPIPMKRMFYPRGMKLSEQFVNAFHREYDRLIGEGVNPKTLVERFGKAMTFHVNEPRKYKLLDEEIARVAALKEAGSAKAKVASSKRLRGKNDPDDRRTKQGDHAPSEEGGGQDGHTGKGRNVSR